MPDIASKKPSTRRALPAYHDIELGRAIPFGKCRLGRDEITAFARAFDPQPFHLSEELARDSNIGMLIASGYHTCAVIMRMMVEDLLDSELSQGAPGVKEVRFLKPVLPDDELSCRCTCQEKRELRSKPGLGIIKLFIELLNQRGELVMTWDTSLFMKVTPPEGRAP